MAVANRRTESAAATTAAVWPSHARVSMAPVAGFSVTSPSDSPVVASQIAQLYRVSDDQSSRCSARRYHGPALISIASRSGSSGYLISARTVP